jgi:rSAM/selenodomain-associated transferase 2
MNEPQLCVIIPAYNEAALIGRTLERVRAALPHASVIVVDGGSTDETVAIATRASADVISALRGRGVQCHAGAMRATSEWLLFLHADTLLPLDAQGVFQVFAANPAVQIGTFRVQFAGGSGLLNALSWIANRVDSVFTRFGDQGILVRRSFYDALGGFPPWPLFEDVALFQKARKLSRVHWLPAGILTSARRFNERGLFRQRLLNAKLMLRYLAGASPFKLAVRYQAASGSARQRDQIECALPAGANRS